MTKRSRILEKAGTLGESVQAVIHEARVDHQPSNEEC